MFSDTMDALRGYDRKPTESEALAPPDQRPWTEYDGMGDKQPRPPFKAIPFGCCCGGGALCVLEFQLPQVCGPDADRCCDVCCRCQLERMMLCGCCGPQCNDVLPDVVVKYCCFCCDGQSAFASYKVAAQECCACDCIENACSFRYAGGQFCCCHFSCVKVPPCCPNCCCLKEEILFMDGDLKPIDNMVMEMR